MKKVTVLGMPFLVFIMMCMLNTFLTTFRFYYRPVKSHGLPYYKDVATVLVHVNSNTEDGLKLITFFL